MNDDQLKRDRAPDVLRRSVLDVIIEYGQSVDPEGWEGVELEVAVDKIMSLVARTRREDHV